MLRLGLGRGATPLVHSRLKRSSIQRALTTGLVRGWPRGQVTVKGDSDWNSSRSTSDPSDQWRAYVHPPSGSSSSSKSGLSSLERSWSTHFGSIRLDTANQPQIHGQQDLFESEPTSSQANEALGHLIFSPHLSETPTTPLNLSGQTVPVFNPSTALEEEEDRNFWFETDDALTRPDVGGPVAPAPKESMKSQPTPRIFHPPKAEPATPPVTPMSTVSPNFGVEEVVSVSDNVFDEQYFAGTPTDSRGKNETLNPTPTMTENDRLVDLNSVDQQYFGTARFIDAPVPTDPTDTLAMRQLVREASQDLNYVDQQLIPPTAPPPPEKNKPAPRPKVARRPLDQTTALAYVEKLRKQPETPESPHKDSADRLWSDSLMKRISTAAQVKDAGDAVVEHVNLSQTTQEPPSKKLASKLSDTFKPQDLEALCSLDIIEKLKRSVIFDKHDIVAINKLYGLEMYHKGSKSFHSVDKYLPDLAKHFDVPELFVVHRLDKNTTGVLLLAKSKLMQTTLTDLFRQRKIDKRYWAIAKGEAEPSEGIINIPLAETRLNERFRMTVRPMYSKSDVITGLKSYKGHVLPAVTEYRVLSSKHRMQLIEAKPITGFRHQIRAHLSLGIKCPILGDHVYDKIDSVGKPQRLPPYALDRLGIRATAARQMPLCLHAKHIQIPEIVPDKNVWVDAAVSHHFNRIMNKLRLRPSRHVKI